ncbi:hypothetical protein [Fournierella massiliensis]|uniref:hypothetical protein n=1 Tax=Allofournierella massiliensis TaxID=1650663 RepID=UPI002943876F|nr:hypothetical protein [Fournierella massiliensis]
MQDQWFHGLIRSFANEIAPGSGRQRRLPRRRAAVKTTTFIIGIAGRSVNIFIAFFAVKFRGQARFFQRLSKTGKQQKNPCPLRGRDRRL